jgi:hypothetical protein
MSIHAKIVNGSYRGQPVNGTYSVVKGYSEGARGGFITIRNPNPAVNTPQVQRVSVQKTDFVLLAQDGTEMPAHVAAAYDADAKPDDGVKADTQFESMFTALESEDEAMERIRETFSMLDKITDACAKGVIRGMVVSGPPGIGKSFGVEKQLESANMFLTLKNKEPNYEVITGGVSTIGLYQKLWHNRHPKNVMVLDDCDAVLFEEESLSLLKGALNSGDKRRIAWNKESRVLAGADIPPFFDFEGSIIFLSNVDFEKTIARGSRISNHLEAIMSRCHYLDLEIGSMRDKILRIKQIVGDGMLRAMDFTRGEERMVLDFVVDNQEHLREVSLRMVKKVADFVKADPKGWREMAESTCLVREAKFKRLLAKKHADALANGVELRA